MFEKEWQSKANIQLVTTSDVVSTESLLFELKRCLTGHYVSSPGAWMVVESCNSEEIAEGDLWQALDDVKVATNGSSSNPGHRRSWVLLRSPGLVPYWLVIEGTWNSNAYARWRVDFYTEKPLGGTLTAGPSGPESFGGYNQTTRGWTHEAGRSVFLCHSLADDGSFVILWNQEGQGFFSGAMIFSKLADPRPLDPHPVLVICAPNRDGSTVPSAAAAAVFSSFTLVTNGLRGGISAPRIGNAGTTGLLTYRSVASATPINDRMNTDIGADGQGTVPDWHIYVYTTGGGDNSIRGRVPDIRWSPLLPHGAMAPDAIEPTSMGVGYLWVPMKEVHNMV